MGRGTMHRPSGVQKLVLLLSLAATATVLPTVAQAQPGELVVNVRTGQELADAVADWGASGSNTTILIDASFISVRNASFHTKQAIAARSGAVEPYSRGRLTIRGRVNADGSPATVLDAGMRQGMIQGLTQAAQLHLTNLIMINMCEWGLNILGFPVSVPWGIDLFPLSGAYRARTFSNLWLYARHNALDMIVYHVIVTSLPIPEVRKLATSLFEIPAGQSTVSDVYTGKSRHFVTADMEGINIVSKSYENPDDPLVAQWRAQGVLMPPQKCDGTPVTDAATQRRAAPVWYSFEQSTFASQLEQATAFTAAPRLSTVTPVVLMVSGGQTAPDNVTYQVSSRFLIGGGQAGNVPSWDQLQTVNLNQRADLLNIARGADVLIQWLGLTGLAVQVPTRLPPRLAGRPPESLLPSVFPLAAFNTSNSPETWNRTAQVILFNVTLAIPPDDYMAVYILTSRQGTVGLPACADPNLEQRVEQLAAGMSSWGESSAADTSLEQHIQQQKQPELFVSSMVGWGFSATLLRLVPTSPVELPSCQSSESPRLGKTQVIGLVVGLSCGIVLLLAALVIVLVCLKQRAVQKRCTGVQAKSKVLGTSHDSQSQQMTSPAPSVQKSLPATSQSRLYQHVRQSQASQEQVFASLASRPEISSTSGATGTAETARSGVSSQGQDSAGQQRLVNKVEGLAAQLKTEGDELLLAGVLGAGGGGTVYMGLWRGLQVAVKTVIFHDKVAADDNSANAQSQRAILETAICASVGHRNVVATYHYDIKLLEAKHDTATLGGLQIDVAPGTRTTQPMTYKLFIIQELCNLSLATALQEGLLAKSEQIELKAVLVVLSDIASGLEYLHSKGIIHGDLKPENVLLKVDVSSVEGVVAKLADFGLSTKLQPGHTHVSNYSSGTPFYVAPEVAVNHQASTASDLYSFGVVMWELFMQQQPCYITSEGKWAWDPLFPNFPASRAPPEVLLRLCHRCLQHCPPARPSASEAVLIIKHVLAHLP